MQPTLDLQAIASEMKAAQDSARQIEPFTARLPGFDLSAAYGVADLMHRARLAEGAEAVGRKIGFTNPDMWARFGVCAPIWAHVYDKTVVQLQGGEGTCRLGGFVEPKIEPEIVFRFRAAPPANASLDDVLGAIDWVALGFEVVQSHFPGWRFQAPDTVADCSPHGALLIGPPQPMAGLGADVVAALESFTLDLSGDGRHVETGRGSNVLGSPLAAIVHLLSVLAAQPDAAPLQAGEIVTTGTITMAHSVRVGETWRSEVHGIGLPGLTIKFLA